jgi:hypothetical protein
MPKPFGATCIMPGCSNQIRYGPEDYLIPVYCDEHRKASGKYAQVRRTREMPPAPKSIGEAMKSAMVVYMCRNQHCHKKKLVSITDWMDGKFVTCEGCGHQMFYHKDA